MSVTQGLPPQTRVNGVQVNAMPGTLPVLIEGCDTISKLFAARCAAFGSRTAHREKDLGIWKSHSWRDYWDHARWAGLGLVGLSPPRWRPQR